MKRFTAITVLVAVALGCSHDRTATPKVRPEPPNDQRVGVRTTADPGATSKPDPFANDDLLAPPQVVAALAIQVNDHIITANEVMRVSRYQLSRLLTELDERQFRLQAEPIIREALRQQINEALVITDAQRQLTDEQKDLVEKAIDTEIRGIIASTGGTRGQFEQMLAAQDVTFEEFREMKRREMIANAYVAEKINTKIHVSRDMLWRYYQSHLDKYRTAKKVKMQILGALYSSYYANPRREPTQDEKDQAMRQARAKVELAAQRIGAGEDFDKLVPELSDPALKAASGGVWDFIEKGSFRETKVEDAAFAMDKGQVSGVIEGDGGVYLVHVVDVQAGQVTSFEQAQESIDGELRQEQLVKLRAAYFEKLWTESTIVSSDEFLNMLLDQAAREHRKS